jgi:O-antigen ligase
MQLSLKSHRSIFIALVCLTYAGLFFPIRFGNIPLAALIAFCIITTRPKAILESLMASLLARILIAVFLFQVIGLIYTDNFKTGLFALEKKISFLLLPIFVLPTLLKFADDRNLILKRIGQITLLSSGVLILIASYRKFVLHYPDAFSYVTGNNFRGFTSIHYVYYSIYFACGSLFLIDAVFEGLMKKKYGWTILALLFFYSVGIIIFVASKTAIFVYGLALTVFLFFKIKNKIAFYISVGLLMISAVIFLSFNSATRARFEGLNKDLSILTKDTLREEIHFTGLNLRLLFWKLNTFHGWKDGVILTGTGTGDVQNYIDSVYALPQYQLYGYLGWDPHNQWVYSLLQLGVMGVFILGFLYIKSFIIAYKRSDLKWMGFLIITFCFTMSESILELNKGIVFFSLIFTILVSGYSNTKISDLPLKKAGDH